MAMPSASVDEAVLFLFCLELPLARFDGLLALNGVLLALAGIFL
jgi:hypothetical protein